MGCETSPEAPSAPATFGTPSLPLYVDKVITTPDSEQVSQASIRFQHARFFGHKSYSNDEPELNVSHVLLAFRKENFVRVLLPGRILEIEAPAGQKYDLSQIWVRGIQNDGVTVEYS